MTDIRAAVAGERTDLADLLAALPAADWDKPTMCAGWRVREVVAHITVALGIDRQVPPDRLRHILHEMKPRHLKYFGVDLTNIQLRATDLDWTHSTGLPLTGTAQDLLLVLCGRTLPPGHLTGPAASRFTEEAPRQPSGSSPKASRPDGRKSVGHRRFGP